MSSHDGSHKLWGGRFAGGPAPELEAVNRSIGTDLRLWPFDVKLSQAWASALATAGVYSAEEAALVRDGLDRVAARIAAGEQPIASDEDVHTFVDRLLHLEVGGPAGRLQTGRSRNDQVATDTRMWTMDALDRVDVLIRQLQEAILLQAEAQQDAIMPAYTHLQRAQPVSVAHWLLSHFWPLARDRQRVASARAAAAVLPLGSGAIAGSAFPVPREQLRDALGFAAISRNSIDAVGDRDFIAESLFALTMLGTHCSRIAEDLILFGSSEFGFVRYGDAYSTGSSMMPQKRNPDALELARGSGARMLGDLVALVGTLKGLPSGYNKDLQEDKRALFDAVDGMTLLLPAVAGSVATLRFELTRMREAVSGAMMATDLADYLVRRSVSFRDAHGAVGRLVREAEERGVDLSSLPFSSFVAAHSAFEQDVLAELAPERSLSHRDIAGGTGPSSVRRQIADAKQSLL
ncbi:argininosuccinate lyase [Pseudogemmatithrix spongiicola]|uniref:Argininosuccinate lyase n=1 Tax=Pseudogemmatithrix spongiicola TaxID=3062599 RepID=A0AA49Q3E8_9BACT|nr:argininosuccinate lyase [Gemmatimonadaceae bacterium 'strain 138']WKW13735.1 argininosuccinate lyase [Gemmatimonadaceae bacterium 'strain 318']